MIVAVPTEELRDAVGPLPGVEYVVWDGGGPPPRADEIEVCVPDYRTTIRTRCSTKKIIKTQVAT